MSAVIRITRIEVPNDVLLGYVEGTEEVLAKVEGMYKLQKEQQHIRDSRKKGQKFTDEQVKTLDELKAKEDKLLKEILALEHLQEDLELQSSSFASTTRVRGMLLKQGHLFENDHYFLTAFSRKKSRVVEVDLKDWLE